MLAWGAAYVPSAWLVETWPPLLAAGARLALGGRAAAGAAGRCSGRPLRPGVGPATVGWLALTQTVLFYGATFWGIAHAGAGLAAVLANTDPLFVAVLAARCSSARRWRAASGSGLLVGLVGATVVVWEGPLWPPALSGGALVVVGGALAWSVGTVVAARGVRGRARPAGPRRLADDRSAAWSSPSPGSLGEGAARRRRRPGGRPDRACSPPSGRRLPLALFYLALIRAPAAEVSAWFFLVPVVGVLTRVAAAGGGRRRCGCWSGWWGSSAGLWLVLRPGGLRGRGRW